MKKKANKRAYLFKIRYNGIDIFSFTGSKLTLSQFGNISHSVGFFRMSRPRLIMHKNIVFYHDAVIRTTLKPIVGVTVHTYTLVHIIECTVLNKCTFAGGQQYSARSVVTAAAVFYVGIRHTCVVFYHMIFAQISGRFSFVSRIIFFADINCDDFTVAYAYDAMVSLSTNLISSPNLKRFTPYC